MENQFEWKDLIFLGMTYEYSELKGSYKALEKCLFVPAQEQQIEQTQTQERKF